MTDLPYEGATPEQLQSPLVREFLAVHNMFRTELANMLNFVQELMAGEQELTGAETQTRVQSLIRAGMWYTQTLHMHHNIETSVMFPRLHQDGLETAVIDRLNADHDAIAEMIDKFSEAIQNFAAIEPDVMNNDLRRLAEALRAHLAYEETHVCPLLARYSHWPLPPRPRN